MVGAARRWYVSGLYPVTAGYAVAGHRARNARRRTQSVRAAFICPALVRFCLLSLRRSGKSTLDTGLLTLFDTRLVDGGRNAQQRMERSLQDGTLNRGPSALRKTELLMEDGALFSGQNARQRTKCSTQGGMVDAGLNARRKTERLTQYSKLNRRRSARRRTQNARRSSLSEVAEQSTIFSVLCF